jgi:hypothetical protein
VRRRRIWKDNIKMDHNDGVRKWTTFKWLRIKSSGEICENSNEFEVFIQRDDVCGTESISRKDIPSEFISHQKLGL